MSMQDDINLESHLLSISEKRNIILQSEDDIDSMVKQLKILKSLEPFIQFKFLNGKCLNLMIYKKT